MNPLCIYHGNCCDGFTAAWAVRHALGEDNVDFYPGIYQEPPPDVTGRVVYFVDFAYKRDVMMELSKVAKSITVLDHHKSAEADLRDLFNDGIIDGVFDMDKSGAMLAWEWFNKSKEPPQLLRHVEDRDLWRFALEGTEHIQAALFSYRYDFELWDRLMLDTDLEDLRKDGVALSRKQTRDVHEFVRVAMRRITVAGHDIPALNVPYFWCSEAGNYMAQGEKFAASYWDTEKTRVFSLRSTEDGMDVSEIASLFGGGGHKHAAGFSVEHGTYTTMEVNPK
jgi:oligoribonuclease NrnB/cAMP/cGMP phosphodiesterase (DHH superfamily)